MRVSLLAAFAAAQLLVAQQPPVFRADTELLELEVRVRDKQGRPIHGLTQEDFRLRDNGEEQRIAVFEAVTRDPAELPGIPGGPRPADPAERPTRVFLLSATSFENAPFVKRSIERFLRSEWPAGYLVAMPGLEFTADRDAALEHLQRIYLSPQFVDQYQAGDEVTFNWLNDGSGGALPAGEAPDPIAAISTSGAAYDQFMMSTRINAFRYRDVVRRLGAFEGEKIIVLFRDGLDVEVENNPWYRDLAGDALRNRVRFYTVDSRGLIPGGDQAAPGVRSGTRISGGRTPLGTRGPQAGGAYARIGDLRALVQDRDLASDAGRNGLRTLAALTAGRAVLNTNDLGEVFDRIAEDRGEYYVLGYYPTSERPGEFRKINVRVDRPGARVETAGGYYEPKPFGDWSKADLYNHLYRALHAEQPASDIAFDFAYQIFAARDGRPEVILSIGVRPGSLESLQVEPEKTKRAEPRERTRFVVAALLDDRKPENPPLYDGRTLAFGHAPTALSRMSEADPTARFHLVQRFVARPGEHKLRIVVRDESNGRIGARDAVLKLPDFAAPYTPSTVLLTTRFGPADPAKPTSLDFGGARLSPPTVAAFPRGSQIFLAYDLYAVSDADLASPPPLRALLRRGPENVSAGFETEVAADPVARRIRYSGVLSAADLDPGPYRLFVSAPEGEKNPNRFLVKPFRILPAQSGPPDDRR